MKRKKPQKKKYKDKNREMAKIRQANRGNERVSYSYPPPPNMQDDYKPYNPYEEIMNNVSRFMGVELQPIIGKANNAETQSEAMDLVSEAILDILKTPKGEFISDSTKSENEGNQESKENDCGTL